MNAQDKAPKVTASGACVFWARFGAKRGLTTLPSRFKSGRVHNLLYGGGL